MKRPKYAKGGIIHGPTPPTDSIPVWLWGEGVEQCTYMTAVAVKARGQHLIKAFNDAVSDDYSRMLDGEYTDPAAYTATAKGSDNG